jgi:uncharacterized membrane protein
VGYIRGGISYTVLARNVLIPAFGGNPDFYWSFHHLGANVGELLLRFATDPWMVLEAMTTPEAKIDTVLFLLWPTAFLSLCSPLMLVALPHIVVRLLARRGWWTMDYHHSAFTVTILFCASVDGARRVSNWLAKRREFRREALVTTWSVMMVAVALALLPRFPFGQLARSDFYELTPRHVAAREALDYVPDGVVVEAANNIGPALSARATVLLWQKRWITAPWVVADRTHPSHGFPSLESQVERIEELQRLGYGLVFERHGWVVLHQPE